MISFVARGLSTISSQIFCYTAISSAGIVGILPGYLICRFFDLSLEPVLTIYIVSSSLELASRNIVCGSVKMVYSLIYTLFLVSPHYSGRLCVLINRDQAFGLQIGSDFYLLFDQRARHQIYSLEAKMDNVITITGTFISDMNANRFNEGFPSVTTFTFTNSTPVVQNNILEGCYRAPDFPWYLKAFPWWTQFFIVPIFSVLSSLMNLQPFWTSDMLVMVVISCASYAANKVANHFIFNQSNIVSAIGAFVVGLLGNVYSRKMGGTAFTAMVTGVLFLVPVSILHRA